MFLIQNIPFYIQYIFIYSTMNGIDKITKITRSVIMSTYFHKVNNNGDLDKKSQ